MEQYSSSRTLDSKTHPGVRFVLAKMSEKRRGELLRSLAPLKEKTREYQRTFQKLSAKRVPSKNADGTPKMNPVTAEQETEWPDKGDELEAGFVLQDLDEFSRTEVKPAYIRWGLQSLEGLEIEGQAATVDLLLEYGPDDLAEEILGAIEGKAELTPEQEKKFASQFTGSEPEHNGTSHSTATSAGNVDTSQVEIALVTTQSN